MSRVPSLHRYTQATVHFSEPDHLTLSPARSQDVLRSPSMLLVSGPEPDTQDTAQTQSTVRNSNHSLRVRPTQSDANKTGGGQMKSGTQQQSEARGRRKGTPSRIPVKQQTATRITSKQTQPARTKRKLRAEQLPRSVPHDTPQSDVSPCRAKSPPVPALAKKLRQDKDCSSDTTTIVPSLVCAKSPPVPALASRLQPDSQTHRSHSPPVPALTSRLQPDSQTHRSHSPPVPALASRLQPHSQTHRSHSPPVPALASRLQPDSQTHRSHSPPVPALASRLQPHSQTHRSHSPPVPALASRLQPHSQTHRSHSPPVPALASRLQPDSQTHRSHSPPVPALTSRLQPDLQTHRSHSPPVPALAKNLQTVRTSSQLCLSPPTQPALPQLVEEAHSMPINRPPSCTLTTTPLPSLPSNTLASTTQNVVTIPPHLSPLPSQGSLPPMTTNRQQTILQQLEMLRQVLRELCGRRVSCKAQS